MSEKHLTELPWKALAIKHKIKDPGLGNALAEFAKCPERDPATRLKAIEAIKKHAATLKKENGKDKEVADYLEEVLKEGARSEKTIEPSEKSPENKPTGENGQAPRDEKAPQGVPEPHISLKDKLVAAMGKVKDRKLNDPPIAATVCQAGKSFGTLLGTGAATAILKELFKHETGHKFVKGTCSYGPGDIYTFTLDTALAGAAKGLKSFFQQQTGRGYKIRVGDPSGQFEEDLESGPENKPKPQGETPSHQVPPHQSPQQVPTTSTAPIDPEKLKSVLGQMGSFVQDVIALDPRRREELEEALQVIEKHLEAGELPQAKEALLHLGGVLKQGPIQIFVKSLDNISLTLTLRQGPQTKVGELLELLEGRTALPLSELRLTTSAGKSLDESKRDLTVDQFDIRKETTLTLTGRLKGGFGERAAVNQVMLAKIKRGNVRDDVIETKGASTAKTKYLRAFKEELCNLAAQTAGVKITPENVHHLDGLVIEALGAGNCGEFAQLILSKLVGATEGQWVYHCKMVGSYMDKKGNKHPFDHAFVITYPTDAEISEMKPSEAMVADAWEDNRISTLGLFMAKNNPYGVKLQPSNIEIVDHGPAIGNAFDTNTANKVKLAIQKKFDEDRIGRKIPVELSKDNWRDCSFEEITEYVDTRANQKDGGGFFDFDLEGKQDDIRRDRELFFTFFQALKSGGLAGLFTEFEHAEPQEIQGFLKRIWAKNSAQFLIDFPELPEERQIWFVKNNSAFLSEAFGGNDKLPENLKGIWQKVFTETPKDPEPPKVPETKDEPETKLDS